MVKAPNSSKSSSLLISTNNNGQSHQQQEFINVKVLNEEYNSEELEKVTNFEEQNKEIEVCNIKQQITHLKNFSSYSCSFDEKNANEKSFNTSKLKNYFNNDIKNKISMANNSELNATPSSTSSLNSIKCNEMEICHEVEQNINESIIMSNKESSTINMTTINDVNSNSNNDNCSDNMKDDDNRSNNNDEISNDSPPINKTLYLSEIETINSNGDNVCNVTNKNINQNENGILTAVAAEASTNTSSTAATTAITMMNANVIATTLPLTAMAVQNAPTTMTVAPTVSCTLMSSCSTPSSSPITVFSINQQNSISLAVPTTPIPTTTLQPGPPIPAPPTLIALSPVTVSQIPQLSPPIQPQVPPPTTSGPQQPSPSQAVSQPPTHSPSPHGSHPSAPPPPPPSHHHHHIFPVHVISIPQPPPGSATAVAGAWPIMEAPIYVDSNGEAHPYCPAHSQGPVPREHRVLLQLDTGASLPLHIAGKRKVFRENTRGRYSSNLSKDTNKNCPTTVQMVSQNRPPPIPVPVQVPQGQVMQQYMNESGTLTHVVLSPTQYQQLHTGQGGVPHIHAPFITANGTTSHFYGPLPTGFPGPGSGPHFHPMPGGHLPPQQMSHSPHSPSPPNNYHKDERTQRQHTKLLRKLDQKREMNSAMSTPAHSPSPRKNDLNGMRRTSRNGASSVGTSEDGEESSSVPDEEDDCQTIIEQLSAVQKPEVTDITSRSAMVRWEAPPMTENIFNSQSLRYDVLLSDRGKEGKYKKILEYGESYVCMIRDLRPGQEYFVCLQVHYEKLQGCASEPAVFITPPCEPDQPLPPKLIARTKNSLQLRWNAPPDNGSHISNYILEYDEGKGKEFIEIIKTKGKQYTLTKLQPSTQYCFRLAAINECGSSVYSDLISYNTSGNPPSVPKPPTLQSATSNSLRLAWEKRPQDEEFVLQMADRESGHGFLNMYNGLDTIYECKGLKRATSYQFRLRVDNEAGSSPWSNDVVYKTYPERPGRPSKPQVKGKIHGTYFKAKWDPPNDKGGAEIRKYFLEISCGAKFERIYTGNEPETVCDRLSPGTTYQIRVGCEGPGGVSSYSDVSTVTTEAVVPGAPDPPFCGNPPGPYAAVLRWNKPDYNGGAPVLEYELQLTGPNYNNMIIYRGKESYCIVKNLIPGEEYQTVVRAVNRIGAGAWSEIHTFSAGAAPPFAPEAPEVFIRSATHLTVSWKEPIVNGAPISEYRLESSLSDSETTNSDSFNICYQGIQTTTDIRNLIPFTIYYFRVCASNLAGISPYSPIVSTQTPAAVPAAPQIKNYEITATEVTLTWSQPESNGSDILYYVIEFGDKSVSTEENVTEFTITNLASETSYKFKVQAVNEIGAGQFSNPMKLTTLPPPPEPPKLECTGVGHNFIKLKWGEGRNLDFTNHYVEMYNNRAKEFQVVYSGTNYMCKVNKLQEQTSYVFRICAETDRAGTGDYSDEYVFKTSATLPSSIKPPRIVDTNSNMSYCSGNSNSNHTNHNNNNNNSNNNYNNNSSSGNTLNPAISSSNNNSLTLGGITGTGSRNLHCFSSNALTVEWQHSKNTFTDTVEYILQCSCGKENDYVEIYRGSDTRFTIDNLEPGSVYFFRVCPVRVTTTQNDLMGSYTPPLRYQVPLHRSTMDCVDAAAHSILSSSLSSSTTHHHHRSHHCQQHHHHHASGGICSDLISQNNDSDVMSKGIGGAVVGTGVGIGGGSIRRFIGKLTSIYTNRKRFSDQEKAVLWMFSFILATVCFAAIVKMFMR